MSNGGRFTAGHKLAKGRPKGVPNKRSEVFAETLIRHNFDVATSMLELYEISLKRFVEEIDKQDRGVISPMESQAQRYLKTCADLLVAMSGYVYPKLKAIEVVKANALDGMSPQEKLEAMKQAVALLEHKVKNG